MTSLPHYLRDLPDFPHDDLHTTCIHASHICPHFSSIQGSIEDHIHKLGSNEAMVQQHAAGALWNLALNNDNKDKIAAAGAIPPLVALLGPQSSSGVQQHAAGALWNLALNNDNKVKIRFAGGVAALTQLMESTTYEGVKRWAENALDWLK